MTPYELLSKYMVIEKQVIYEFKFCIPAPLFVSCFQMQSCFVCIESSYIIELSVTVPTL